MCLCDVLRAMFLLWVLRSQLLDLPWAVRILLAPPVTRYSVPVSGEHGHHGHHLCPGLS